MLDKIRDALADVPDWLNLLWVAAAGVLTLGILLFSVTDVEPGQVAVRLGHLTGSQEAIAQPGWVVRMPFLQSVYLLDAAPQTFVMSGEKTKDALNERELTVRASDGSNFHFTDTTIIFQIAGADAVNVLADSGPGHGFLKWMKPYARSLLRDEFGRESTIHVSDPTTYGAAANRAMERLNKLLGAHGVRISQVVTPRPRFNESYEKLIEERNSLNNELQVIESNLARAHTDRDRALAEVDREQNRIIQEKRASLESDLARAIAEQSNAKRETDTYRIEHVAGGQAKLSGSKELAVQLKGELDALYDQKRAEVEAFRNQPVERVMQRLGDALEGVTIAIQPWSDDATPKRVRYENLRQP